jgi:hypothetical protein
MTRQRMQRRPGRAHSAASAESSRAPLDLEQVAARAAEIVLARLSAGLAAEPAAFSTHRDGPRPREYARRPRAWRQLAPQIPGAVRLGRWVTVPREAYDRWLAAQGSNLQAPPASGARLTRQEAEWSPADVARDLGLRLPGERASHVVSQTKGGGR